MEEKKFSRKKLKKEEKRKFLLAIEECKGKNTDLSKSIITHATDQKTNGRKLEDLRKRVEMLRQLVKRATVCVNEANSNLTSKVEAKTELEAELLSLQAMEAEFGEKIELLRRLRKFRKEDRGMGLSRSFGRVFMKKKIPSLVVDSILPERLADIIKYNISDDYGDENVAGDGLPASSLKHFAISGTFVRHWKSEDIRHWVVGIDLSPILTPVFEKYGLFGGDIEALFGLSHSHEMFSEACITKKTKKLFSLHYHYLCETFKRDEKFSFDPHFLVNKLCLLPEYFDTPRAIIKDLVDFLLDRQLLTTTVMQESTSFEDDLDDFPAMEEFDDDDEDDENNDESERSFRSKLRRMKKKRKLRSQTIPVRIVVVNRNFFVDLPISMYHKREIMFHIEYTPRTRPFFTGILVGNVLLYFNARALVIPLVLTHSSVVWNTFYFGGVTSHVKRSFFEAQGSRGVVDCIQRWNNMKKRYGTTGKFANNCQAFVEDVVECLDLRDMLCRDTSLTTFMKNVKASHSKVVQFDVEDQARFLCGFLNSTAVVVFPGGCGVNKIPWDIKRIYDWTNEDVIEWLRCIGFDEYFETTFRKLHIQGKHLPNISFDDPMILQMVDKRNKLINLELYKRNRINQHKFLVYFFHLKQTCLSPEGRESHSTGFFSTNFIDIVNKVYKNADVIQYDYEAISQHIASIGDRDLLVKSKLNINEYMRLFFKKRNQIKVKIIVTEMGDNTQWLKSVASRVLDLLRDINLVENKIGLFHSAILIGPMYLQWTNSELIVPKKIESRNALLMYDVDPLELRIAGDKNFDDRDAQIRDIQYRIADIIVKWNTKYTYSKTRGYRRGNCQHFVDDIIQCLGISEQLVAGTTFSKFICKLRKEGNAEFLFEPAPEFLDFYEVSTDKDLMEYSVKRKGRKFRFKTHAELDQYVHRIVTKLTQEPPQLSIMSMMSKFPSEYKLLKSFDRAFWLRHLKEPIHDDYAPSLKNKIYSGARGLSKCGCPFGHPRGTGSIGAMGRLTRGAGNKEIMYCHQ